MTQIFVQHPDGQRGNYSISSRLLMDNTTFRPTGEVMVTAMPTHAVGELIREGFDKVTNVVKIEGDILSAKQEAELIDKARVAVEKDCQFGEGFRPKLDSVDGNQVADMRELAAELEPKLGIKFKQEGLLDPDMRKGFGGPIPRS
jgi:hypothetical protein